MGVELFYEGLAVKEASVTQRPVKQARTETERLSLIFFADNFWLLAESRRQLQAMFTKLCALLDRAGLSTDVAACSWSSTSRTPPAMGIAVPNIWPDILSTSVTSPTVTVPFKTRHTAMKILGSMIACSGDCTAEIDYRIARAWAAFHKHSKLLLCRSAPVMKRLDKLRAFVLPALLYNIGTCHLTKKHLSRLRGVEQKMMRRVLGYRLSYFIDPQADVEDYMAISALKLKGYRQKGSWHRWDEEALLRAYRWAGHVARITARAPARLAGKALLYRGAAYLQRVTRLYGHQGHYRRFHAWRWEQLFSRRWGPNWQQHARQGEVWEDMAAQWLQSTSGIHTNTEVD